LSRKKKEIKSIVLFALFFAAGAIAQSCNSATPTYSLTSSYSYGSTVIYNGCCFVAINYINPG